MSDLLRKYKSLYSSTCNTFSTGEGVTITPASVTGLPTDTEITLTFDRVDSSGTKTPSKMERIRGTITGGNFVISSGGRAVEGTEQVHTSPVVEMIWNADDWNDTVDWGLVEHSQLGVHDKTKVVDLTTAQTLTNKTLTSPKINEDVVLTSTATELNALDGQTGAWGNWTPSLTNITQGSGVVIAKYCKIGKTVHFRFKFTLAADSSIGTSPYFSLPVPAAIANGVNFTIWLAGYAYNMGFADISTGNLVLNCLVASGSYLTTAAVSATVPFTWATGHYIQVNGTYEAE